ncbi:hypothetical protein AJ80_02500 [Polytolypa hystricis UAMH7299]|uniref:Wax synthase domain-containing protein n=1 Tax=Polytolypa hystricis (strain UAMH7299) TaxID=1447883 RepID=A0A2B7YQF0_POLH7|nr:hypothetical protein AJ80_02500 [Polytolypa hystricis UAMH7299]
MDPELLPVSYRALLNDREARFERELASGHFMPLLFPHNFAPPFILIVALLIPHRHSSVSKLVRCVSYICILYWTYWNTSNCRTLGLGNGYGVGLVSFWFAAWSASLLLFNDVQRDFKRIERSIVALDRKETQNPPTDSRSETAKSTALANDDSSTNGYRWRQGSAISSLKASSMSTVETDVVQETYLFRWQGYPETRGHRLTWILDLISSFRGPWWNFRSSTLPPLPDSIPAQVKSTTSKEAKWQTVDLNSTKAAFWFIFRTFAICYIVLDILKVTVMRDPYFWGMISAPPPKPLDALGPLRSILLTHIYRLSIFILALFTGLTFIPAIPSLIYLSLSLIPGFRRWISIPMEAPWQYPRLFGPFFSSIMDHGLPGAWSKWWHQLFRPSFTAPSAWLFPRLPTSWQKPPVKLLLFSFTAFTLSGMYHAFGSYTQFADTKPFYGTFMFFFLQAPGAILQSLLAKLLVPRLPFRPPRWLRRLTNILVFVIWVGVTGPLLADDFAKGGVWLFEPIPISPLRGLGFGAQGEGWWCWHGKWVTVWRGEEWWNVGLRIV